MGTIVVLTSMDESMCRRHSCWKPRPFTNMTMAKNKANKKKSTVQTSKSRGLMRQSDLDPAGVAHAAMLYDPCGADLMPTTYPGDRGYINRFVLNNTLGGLTGQTAVVMIMKPGNAVGTFHEVAGASTSITLSYGTTVPGNTFLNANAAKIRSAAYCVTARPVASATNVTGTIHFGIVNATALSQGLVTTPDQLIQLCSESVSASQALMAPLELKWSPGGFDDRYTAIPQVTSDDDSDRNCLLVVAIGLPAATGIQFRHTAIVEWSPKVNLGITNDATSVKPSRCDKDCVLQALKRKDKEWWWSLGKKTWKVGKTIAGGYMTGGITGALGSAVKLM